MRRSEERRFRRAFAISLALHLGALVVGGLSGVGLFVGLAILIYRRRSNRAVFRATTWNDKIMFLVLAIVIVAGLVATFTGDTVRYRAGSVARR